MSKQLKKSSGVKLNQLSVAGFADELGSASPAPGGGSTAALAGSMACGLISMVVRITLKREEEIEGVQKRKLMEWLTDSDSTRKQFLDLINEDTDAFNEIIKSYKLPKSTNDEKQKRDMAIQRATKYAAEVPLSTAQLSLKTLARVKDLLEICAPQTITDLGVAGVMAYVAVTGAVWNVKINLGTMKDNDYVKEKQEKLNKIVKTASEHWEIIRNSVESKI